MDKSNFTKIFLIVILLVIVIWLIVWSCKSKNKYSNFQYDNFEKYSPIPLQENEIRLYSIFDKIIQKNNVKFAYILDAPIYIIEFLMPIFAVFPGKLITNTDHKHYNKIVELFKKKGFLEFIHEFTANDLKKYIKK